MGCRENGNMLQNGMQLPCQGIHLGNPVDFVSEKFHPDQIVSALGRINLHTVPSHPETAAAQIHVIPVILYINQFPQNLVPFLYHTGPQGYDHIFIFIRAAQAVNTGNTGHYNNILALRKRCRSGQSQFVNLIIDGGILGNIGIRRRHIGFRLIIIVIAHEILHRILREKFLEFAVKLSGKRFIMSNNQGRLLNLLDDVRHGKCLSGTCDTQQGLELVAFLKSGNKLFNSLRLIAGGLIL